MKTYPNLTLARFLKWTTLGNIKRIRPLWYLPYDKNEARKLLSERYDWAWYGGHHLENRFTAFYHAFLMPQRFRHDFRVLGHAALVRSNQLDRDLALEQLKQPPHCPEEIIAMVKKRLGFSEEEFERVLTLPVATWHDFQTYKPVFERLRPFFWVLMKLNRVPESFYMKFCKPFTA
jgi:hypothetical protein